MNLDELLERRRATLPELVDTIWDKLECAADDQLLAVGSLVEGVGNLTSDVDFILLSDRRIDAADAAGRRPVTVCGLICDVNLIPRQLLEAKHALLRHWSMRARQLADTKMLSGAAYQLLHRVAHSRKVAGVTEDPFDLHECRALLALHRLERARYEAYALLVDIPGFIGEGQWAALATACNELLGYSSDAVLAAHGVTIPARKWRFQLLQHSCGTTQQPGHEFVAPLLELHRWPSPLGQDAMILHARRVAALARGVFLWAKSRMTPAMDPVPLLPPSQADATADAVTSATLDFDVAFVFPDDKIHLVRLNRAESGVEVSARLAALLCRFDGVTRREELQRCAAGLSASGTPLIVEEAEALVALRGLGARAYVVEDRLQELLGNR